LIPDVVTGERLSFVLAIAVDGLRGDFPDRAVFPGAFLGSLAKASVRMGAGLRDVPLAGLVLADLAALALPEAALAALPVTDLALAPVTDLVSAALAEVPVDLLVGLLADLLAVLPALAALAALASAEAAAADLAVPDLLCRDRDLGELVLTDFRFGPDRRADDFAAPRLDDRFMLPPELRNPSYPRRRGQLLVNALFELLFRKRLFRKLRLRR
jgi:hypothetical protein